MTEKKHEHSDTCDHVTLNDAGLVMYSVLNTFRKEVCLEHSDCVLANAKVAAYALGMLTQAVAEVCSIAGVSADVFADDLLLGSKSLEVTIQKVQQAKNEGLH